MKGSLKMLYETRIMAIANSQTRSPRRTYHEKGFSNHQEILLVAFACLQVLQTAFENMNNLNVQILELWKRTMELTRNSQKVLEIQDATISFIQIQNFQS